MFLIRRRQFVIRHELEHRDIRPVDSAIRFIIHVTAINFIVYKNINPSFGNTYLCIVISTRTVIKGLYIANRIRGRRILTQRRFCGRAVLTVAAFFYKSLPRIFAITDVKTRTARLITSPIRTFFSIVGDLIFIKRLSFLILISKGCTFPRRYCTIWHYSVIELTI